MFYKFVVFGYYKNVKGYVHPFEMLMFETLESALECYRTFSESDKIKYATIYRKIKVYEN